MKMPKSLTTVTKFSKFLAVCIIVAFILGAFRLGMNYQYSLDWGAIHPKVALIPTTTPSQTGNIVTITAQDNGKTEQAHVGDKVLIQLAGNLDWHIKLANTSALHATPDGIMYTQQTQGRYRVVAPGTVDIVASGIPVCQKGEMCPMFVLAFHTTVVVRN